MTNQQSTVLIALTRTNVPRTPREISVETGIPEASIRRTLHELRQGKLCYWPERTTAR